MVKNKKTQDPSDNDKNDANNQSPIRQQPNGDKLKQPTPHKEERNKTKKSTYNKMTVGVALFALAVSISAAYFSYRQVDIAEDTAQRQLRAYLSTEIVGWQGLDGKYLFATTIRIVNYGQTPAKMVQLAGQVEILPYPLPENFVPHYSQINNITQNFTVFPNIRDSTAIGGKIPAKYIFTKEQIARFTSDTSKVRAYSFERITYLDVFGITHHTVSCRFLEPKSIVYNTNGSIRTFMMANYSKYNYID